MNTPEKEIETFCPVNRQHWREWLQNHHAEKQFVWLIYHKKKSGLPSITWSEAVDEALCFGWIDSLTKTVDDERYRQFFSRRKPNSVWSRINKEKVERLIAGGLMTQPGFKAVDIAKQNGSWAILDEVEAGIIPADLELAFQAKPNAKSYFLSLSQSDKRNTLQWLVLAKRAETRQNRIAEIVERASQGLKPKATEWQKNGLSSQKDNR